MNNICKKMGSSARVIFLNESGSLSNINVFQLPNGILLVTRDNIDKYTEEEQDKLLCQVIDYAYEQDSTN